MTNLNKATIIGRIGKDPETRYTQSGKMIVSFTAATDSGYKDKATGQWVSKPQWHNIVIMNDALAKIVAQNARKGSLVYIEGAIEYEQYTDKQGVQKNSTKIVVGAYDGSIKLLDARKNDAHDNSVQQHTQNKGNAYVPDDGSEIPF